MAAIASETSRWRCSLDADTVYDTLMAFSEDQQGPFGLTWKLSGAGIVGRVMDLPDGEHRFVAWRTQRGIQLVLAPEPNQRHAFESIAEVSATNVVHGCEVDMVLRIHREHRLFALPFVGVGLICIVGAILAPDVLTITLALVLGVLFLGVPALRARLLFRASAEKTQNAVVHVLELAPLASP